MEACKHKQSGKYFIYIYDTGGNEALMVTPLAQIKSLDLKQFYEIENLHEDYLMSNRIIEPEQVNRLKEYQKSRSEENHENVRDLLDEMTEYQKKELLELLKK